MREPKNDRYQIDLLPQCIDDFIPATDPVRILDSILNQIDLKAAGIYESDQSNGVAYSALTLLGIWVLGYLNNVRSTRELEKCCLKNMDFIWMTGGQKPDHNTLWRFFSKYSESFASLFSQIVKICCMQGLVKFALHAVDGTKIKSRASSRKGISLGSLKKEEKKITNSIRKMIDAIRNAGAGEEQTERLEDKLSGAEQRKKAIQDSINELKKNNQTCHHPVDPESNIMKTTEGLQFSYNAQAVVDTDSGIVVASDVVTKGNDNSLINKMIDQVEEITEQVGQTTVADTGYSDSLEFAKASEKNRNIIVAIPESTRLEHGLGPSRHKFTFDEESNTYTCPKNAKLKQNGIAHGKSHMPRYCCERKNECQCKTSPENKGPRRVTRNIYDNYFRNMQIISCSQEGKYALTRRKSSVERVFAQVKSNMGFRRFTGFGLKSASAQWNLIMTAYNIKTLIKYIQKNGNYSLDPDNSTCFGHYTDQIKLILMLVQQIGIWHGYIQQSSLISSYSRWVA